MSKGPRDTVNGRMRGFKSSAFWQAVSEALYESADAVRAEADNSIVRGSASGHSGGKHQHVPSKPGQPPNNDTGGLRNSISVAQLSPLTARVKADAPHAAALEFGTSKMAERPYMRPARDKVRPKAQRLLRKRINDALRKERRRNR